MAIRALFLDFKVFAPISINYQRALDYLSRYYVETAKPPPTDIFAYIDSVKEKATKKDFDEFALGMSKLLDEIETAQVGNFQLYMGVKNGLAALDSLDASVVALTELGVFAAEKFLKDRNVNDHIGKIVAREKIGEPCDLTSRLNRALGKGELKQEECVYFCNKLADMKLAKSSNFKTVVLPSKGEKLDLMMLEKPVGMIMSLEEIPNLLSIQVARDGKPKVTHNISEDTESDASSNEPTSDSRDFPYGESPSQ
jgi:phosphoglycolate phosphatase-like HAD superfamily hydrolase